MNRDNFFLPKSSLGKKIARLEHDNNFEQKPYNKIKDIKFLKLGHDNYFRQKPYNEMEDINFLIKFNKSLEFLIAEEVKNKIENGELQKHEKLREYIKNKMEIIEMTKNDNGIKRNI